MSSRRWLVVFALLLAAVPASADPEAEAVRDKVRAAVGYDAFRKMEHGVVIEGVADGEGNPGRFSYRVHPDGRFAVAINRRAGGSYGFDGTTRWSRTFTNPALPAELDEAASLRLRDGLLAHRWVDPKAGFTVATDPRESRAYRPCLVVRHPDALGVTAQVYIDPATWLPTQFTLTDSRGDEVIEVTDWRGAGGMKVFGKLAVDRYRGGKEWVTDTANPAPAPTGVDPFAPPAPAADTRFDPMAPPAVEARVGKSGYLMVRPSLNGRPGPWFAVSTMATYCSLTAAVADRLGLPTFGRTTDIGGARFATRYRTLDRLTVGPVEVTGLVTVESPPDLFNILGQWEGVEVGGMVGSDLLSRMVLEADWTAGTVAAHDPARYRPPAEVVWETARFSHGYLHVPAVFEGKYQGVFRFAAGMHGVVQFTAAATRALKLLDGRQTSPTTVRMIAGEFQAERAAGAGLRAFGRDIRPVVAEFLTTPRAEDPYPHVLGEFSPALLGRGTVVFDYPHRRIGFVAAP